MARGEGGGWRERQAKPKTREGLRTRPRKSHLTLNQADATPVHLRPHPSAEETATGSFREDRAARRAAILGRLDALGHSFKESLRHHPLVFVFEEMAVKDVHAPHYGVGEVHNDVDATGGWDIHGVQPQWIGDPPVVLRAI